MPNPPVFEPQYLYDALGSFDQGVNGGVDPLKIPRHQLAGAINATVRGTFIRPRSAYRKMALDFGGDASLQAAASQAVFQGGGYYKPDAGLECLMSANAGRLFQFQVDGTTAHVSELTTSSLRQSDAVSQAWLWQSERWMIFNDGISLPLFYDGTSIRRSIGNTSSIVGTTSGFSASSPGNTNVSIPLTGPYTGPLPGGVLIVGKKYTITSQSTAGSSAFTIAGVSTCSPNASQVLTASPFLIKKPSSFYAFSLTAVPASNAIVAVNISAPYNGALTTGGVNNPPTQTIPPNSIPPGQGPLLSIGNTRYNILGISADKLTLTVQPTTKDTAVARGVNNPVSIYGIALTWTTVGTISSATVTEPATGAAFSFNLSSAYTGTLNDYLTVFDQTQHLFQINVTSAATDTSVVYTAIATNVNDNSGIAIPAATSLIMAGQELPIGRMGAYGLGRNWVCLADGISFIASDQIGDSSGTLGYGYRDAVLQVTQNAFLLGGGVFRVPSSGEQITAMVFIPTLDAALGQGPLAVLTPHTVFSCQAPVDRTTWASLTNPILSVSMIDSGAQGQNSSVCANSDLIFRSLNGFRSLILARRDFNTWGNVPISREVETTLSADDKALLSFGSAVTFDNRLISTANPITSSLGVYHTKLVLINFDPISSLAGKSASVYDGIWQDLNVLQLIKGQFSGLERAFAFCVSSDQSSIELWEILPTDGPNSLTADNGTTPIVWEYQSAAMNFYQNDPRKRDFLRLLNGELRIDRMNASTGFETFYKPDQWPSWVPWASWTEQYDSVSDPAFRPTLGLGEPNERAFDEKNDRPLRECTTIQFRVRVTGYCRILASRFLACTIPAPDFAKPSG